jgi:myosin heavy chain 6/7
MCNLSADIMDYHNVAQGKTTIPNVDDGEECLLTDVRKNYFNRQNFSSFSSEKKIQINSIYLKFGFYELTLHSIELYKKR